MELTQLIELFLANFHLVYIVMLLGFAIYFAISSGMWRRMRDDADNSEDTFAAFKIVAAHAVTYIFIYLKGYVKYLFHFVLMFFILGIIFSLTDFNTFVMFTLALMLARINMLLREMSKPKYLILTAEELARFKAGDKEIKDFVNAMEVPKELNTIKDAIGSQGKGKPK